MTAAGTATAIALAGCADSGPGGNESGNETTNGTEAGNESEGSGETYTLTATVENEQGPVEGATVTLERAGTTGAGGTGNESENESDNETATDDELETDNESENESNGTTASDDGGLGNESGNETGNESGNETGNETENETEDDATSDIGGQAFPMEKETDENGEVQFEELENGEYAVTAENEGQQTETDVEIDGGDEDVTLTLGEGGTGGNETGNETESNETGDNESDGM